jgi:hypothetical protein
MTTSKKRWTNRALEASGVAAAPLVATVIPLPAKAMPTSIRIATPVNPRGARFTRRSIISFTSLAAESLYSTIR